MYDKIKQATSIISKQEETYNGQDQSYRAGEHPFNIIKDDKKKKIYIGKIVRFMPSILAGDNYMATEIEIL